MNTYSRPEIICLAGTFVSGKDTYANHLVKQYGYRHANTADILRQFAMERRGSIERPVLFEVAKEMREKDGAGVFVKMALEGSRPVALTAIRSLGEANEVKKAGGITVFIDAPAEVRYERMKYRHRDEEVKLTLEEFKAGEQKEWYGGDSDTDFNLRGIKAMADMVFENVYPTVEEFFADLDKRLGLKQ